MTWVIFVVFEVLVVGGAMILLLLAFEGIKASQRTVVEGRDGEDQEPADLPRFLARRPLDYPAAPGNGFEDLAMARFQQYLRAEQELAEQFVSKPSVASLYRNSERCLTLN